MLNFIVGHQSINCFIEILAKKYGYFSQKESGGKTLKMLRLSYVKKGETIMSKKKLMVFF